MLLIKLAGAFRIWAEVEDLGDLGIKDGIELIPNLLGLGNALLAG